MLDQTGFNQFIVLRGSADAGENKGRDIFASRVCGCLFGPANVTQRNFTRPSELQISSARGRCGKTAFVRDSNDIPRPEAPHMSETGQQRERYIRGIKM